ncbi:MAG: hypothetical protein AAGG68_14835 [Bacteroidota bacterium]
MKYKLTNEEKNRAISILGGVDVALLEQKNDVLNNSDTSLGAALVRSHDLRSVAETLYLYIHTREKEIMTQQRITESQMNSAQLCISLLVEKLSANTVLKSNRKIIQKSIRLSDILNRNSQDVEMRKIYHQIEKSEQGIEDSQIQKLYAAAREEKRF